MDVFWGKGFEGAQVSDLTAVMGINPPSFYAAFGSKEAVFREALELYLATIGVRSIAALNDTPHVRDAVRAMLVVSAETALAAPQSAGCLASIGLVNGSQNHQLRREMSALRRITADRVRLRIERGVSEGQLPHGLNAESLGIFYGAVVQALSLQAQDGSTRDELMATIEGAMRALEF